MLDLILRQALGTVHYVNFLYMTHRFFIAFYRRFMHWSAPHGKWDNVPRTPANRIRESLKLQTYIKVANIQVRGHRISPKSEFGSSHVCKFLSMKRLSSARPTL